MAAFESPFRFLHPSISWSGKYIVPKYEAGARRLDLLELKEVCDATGVELVEFVRRFDAELEVASEDKRHTRKRRGS
jgi:hypothetical protein